MLMEQLAFQQTIVIENAFTVVSPNQIVECLALINIRFGLAKFQTSTINVTSI